MTLTPAYNTWSVHHLLMTHREGKINLSPGFQRDSVWSRRDRQKLIESIVRSKPIPNIFHYASGADGAFAHAAITLRPLNPAFDPILLTPENEGEVRIVGEVVQVVG